MSRGQRSFAKKKQKKLERRKQRERKTRRAPAVTLSRQLGERLGDAYDLIRRGDFAEAEKLLHQLDQRGKSCPEVVEALVFLYQTTRDRENCCHAAERLAELRPRDPEARLIFAQESMFCGRATIALLNYQSFVERWPEHPHVSKAKEAIELLVPEAENRVRDAGFPRENGLDWYALHETALSLLRQNRFPECATKCKELLDHVPTFASARNNLAIAYFQSGRVEDSVAVAEETRRLLPENDFAKVALAKLYFLTGREHDANRLTDQIVADPPSQQDSVVALFELLALLGRDDDIVHLAETTDQAEMVEDSCQAARLHYLAYAKCRLGDTKSAQTFWKKALKKEPHLLEARENMLDLKSGEGHAPWGSSLPKWIPRQVIDRIVNQMVAGAEDLAARAPGVASLVPALLDRGDPVGRELACRLAMADSSPRMLDALKQFAFGSRGPDSLRSEALMFLSHEKAIGAGPHRIYVRGEWAEVQTLAAEITAEPHDSGMSPRVAKLISDGSKAMRACDYDLAENSFQQALLEDPSNCSAAYNLCTVSLRRDGVAGQKNVRPRLQQLHDEYPEYPFAAIALSQFAAMDGDFQKARDLLAPIFQAKKMHVSEATALFTAQTTICLKQRDVDGAARAFEMLRRIADEDDPNLPVLRADIDRASKKKGLLRALLG